MAQSTCSLEDWTAHATDMFADMPKYLENAEKDAPCSRCAGTGKVLTPNERAALQREILFGLFVCFGAGTSHAFPGDPCPHCDGTGVSAFLQQKIAAERFAKDWFSTMNELFGPNHASEFP